MASRRTQAILAWVRASAAALRACRREPRWGREHSLERLAMARAQRAAALGLGTLWPVEITARHPTPTPAPLVGPCGGGQGARGPFQPKRTSPRPPRAR